MKYWMLLEERTEQALVWFWNGKSTIRVDEVFITGKKEVPMWNLNVQSLAYPEMNAVCQAAYDQGSRIVSAGGKTFEVLASGRI